MIVNVQVFVNNNNNNKYFFLHLFESVVKITFQNVF